MGLEDKDMAETGFTASATAGSLETLPLPRAQLPHPPPLTGQMNLAAALGAGKPWAQGTEPGWRQPQDLAALSLRSLLHLLSLLSTYFLCARYSSRCWELGSKTDRVPCLCEADKTEKVSHRKLLKSEESNNREEEEMLSLNEGGWGPLHLEGTVVKSKEVGKPIQ